MQLPDALEVWHSEYRKVVTAPLNSTVTGAALAHSAQIAAATMAMALIGLDLFKVALSISPELHPPPHQIEGVG